jgi:hypothetical protein
VWSALDTWTEGHALQRVPLPDLTVPSSQATHEYVLEEPEQDPMRFSPAGQVEGRQSIQDERLALEIFPTSHTVQVVPVLFRAEPLSHAAHESELLATPHDPVSLFPAGHVDGVQSIH